MDMSGDSVLLRAAREGNLDKIRDVIAENAVLLEETDSDGRNALHEAARGGHTDCVNLLLHSGVKVDSLTNTGWTPLMIACATTDNLDVVKTLVEHGASLTMAEEDGYTPFHIACRHGQRCIIKFMLDSDPGCWDTSNNIGSKPFHTAAQHGRLEVVQVLLERCNYQIDSKDSNGLTPVMYAESGHHDQVVHYLHTKQKDCQTDALATQTANDVTEKTGRNETMQEEEKKPRPLEGVQRTDRVIIKHLSEPHDFNREMQQDIQIAFSADQKYIPSQYHYDKDGSVLFEAVTKVPEYYVARIETALLQDHAAEIMQRVKPDELVELGSGSSTKTCLLLEAMHTIGGKRYVPIEISEAALYEAANTLSSTYDWLHIDGYVGSYHTDLPLVKRSSDQRCLLTFLGTTLGNYTSGPRKEILRQIASFLRPGDAMLLGIDLVKDKETILLAYNDPAGVNTRFNINVLNVLNRGLGADFDISNFSYCPTWNNESSSVESFLRADREMTVNIPALDMKMELNKDELITIFVSYKFTREKLREELLEVGLDIDHFYTDSDTMYAVVLVTPVVK